MVLRAKMMEVTNLKRNVLVAESDLELLSAVFVLLWPLRVVLPACY